MTSIPQPPVLSVEHLSFGYGEKPVLTDISFQAHANEFLAVTGPNGCGKTTLIKLLLKNQTPDSGRILFMQKDIADLTHQKRSRVMAAVHQTIDPASMTVRDYVLLGRMPYFKQFQFFEAQKDLDIAYEYMNLTGIAHLSDELVTRISGGERQLAAIARALTQEPILLVLDEPTAHLDITHQKMILDLIVSLKDKLSLTLIMVLHDLNLAAEYSDRMILLSRETRSVFSSGTPGQVLTHAHITEVYKTEIRVQSNPFSGKPWVLLTNDQIGKADGE